MAELADRFEHKLSQAQQKPSVTESDQRPVIMDAFFGTPAATGGPNTFLKQINQPTSNFNKNTQNVQGKIFINVQVDAPSKTANFVVRVDPAVKGPVLEVIKKALRDDYAAAFRTTPEKQLQERLAKNDINPPTVSGTTDLVTM